MKPKLSEPALAELITNLEQWMREGRGAEVAEAIADISPAGLPRAFRLPLANLARRAGLVSLGLRILGPLVKPKSRCPEEPATNPELAEYAMLLDQAGSAAEAQTLLEKLPAIPEVSLHRAFCHMGRWEYREAGPHLEAFLRFPSISGYQRLVGTLNLAAVKIFLGDLPPARDLLNQVIPEAMIHGYRRLLVNSLELLAQTDIQNGNYARGEERILQARQTLLDSKSTDSLYLEKWLAVIEALQTGKAAPLESFRSAAEESHYYEGVRDAEYYILKITGDEALFRRLYFGTPFPSYRAHLKAGFPSLAVPASLELGSGESVFELETGELNGRAVDELSPGKKIHQLIALLFSDFYRPFRLGTVFGTLFPGEHFNVNSAPNRVHQLVSRARKLLESMALPIHVLEKDGLYRAELAPGLRIRLAGASALPTAEDAQLARLRKQFGGAAFTARSAREALGLSLASMHRLLRAGLESGSLAQSGQGRSTVYQFVSGMKQPKAA